MATPRKPTAVLADIANTRTPATGTRRKQAAPIDKTLTANLAKFVVPKLKLSALGSNSNPPQPAGAPVQPGDQHVAGAAQQTKKAPAGVPPQKSMAQAQGPKPRQVQPGSPTGLSHTKSQSRPLSAPAVKQPPGRPAKAEQQAQPPPAAAFGTKTSRPTPAKENAPGAFTSSQLSEGPVQAASSQAGALSRECDVLGTCSNSGRGRQAATCDAAPLADQPTAFREQHETGTDHNGAQRIAAGAAAAPSAAESNLPSDRRVGFASPHQRPAGCLADGDQNGPPATASSASPKQQSPPRTDVYAGMHSPEYRPEEEGLSLKMQSLELACQTAISKRRTRGPAVPAPLQRFGEWYQGDDTELDETLMEYNDAHGSPGGGRRQERNRRKSAFPTFTSRMAETDADGIEAEAEVEQAAARRGPKATRQRRSTLAPGQDTRQEVAALAQELMRQADQLLPGEAPEKKRGRAKAQADEAQPLRVRLQQAWHGKSYYERLRDMADGEGDQAAQQAGPRASKPDAAAAVETPPGSSDAPVAGNTGGQKVGQGRDVLPPRPKAASRPVRTPAKPKQPSDAAATSDVAQDTMPAVARPTQSAVGGRISVPASNLVAAQHRAQSSAGATLAGSDMPAATPGRAAGRRAGTAEPSHPAPTPVRTSSRRAAASAAVAAEPASAVKHTGKTAMAPPQQTRAGLASGEQPPPVPAMSSARRAPTAITGGAAAAAADASKLPSSGGSGRAGAPVDGSLQGNSRPMRGRGRGVGSKSPEPQTLAHSETCPGEATARPDVPGPTGALEAELAELRGQLKAAAGLQATLAQRTAASEAQAAGQKAEAAAAKSSQADLKKQLAALARQQSTAGAAQQAAMDAARSEADALRKQVASLERQNADLKKQHASAARLHAKEHKQQAAQIADAQTVSVKLTAELERCRAELASQQRAGTAAAAQQAKQRQQALQSQANSQADTDRLNADLQQAQDAMRKCTREAQEAAAMAMSEKVAREAQVDDLQHQLQHLAAGLQAKADARRQALEATCALASQQTKHLTDAEKAMATLMRAASNVSKQLELAKSCAAGIAGRKPEVTATL